MSVEINQDAATKLVAGISIPPRPAALADLMAERAKDEPDLQKVARLIGGDIGLSAAMLKAVNSPYFGLSRKVDSAFQAISMMGMKNVMNIVTGLMLRNAVGGKNVALDRFWENSQQNAMLSAWLAKRLPGISADEAYTFGLFHDCGIPILMQKFPDYKDTLFAANAADDTAFTLIEDQRHATNHATIGFLVAKTWLLPEMLCEAIRLHHDETIYTQPDSAEPRVRNLVSISRLAEHLNDTLLHLRDDSEWGRLGGLVLGHLGITDTELSDIKDDVGKMV